MRWSAATSTTRRTTSAGEHPGRCSPPWRWATGPVSRVGRRPRASRARPCGLAGGTTGSGGRTTTTAASAPCTAPPDEALTRETAAVLARHAVRADGLVNWPGALGRPLVRPRDGRICLQWCTGAPGVLAGAWDYLDEELLLAGAELVWQAGAHGDEKGHGLCHGTSGNGWALLKAFARTGDERWLERARRFAVHALSQAERTAIASARHRYSLFTGDVGTALFAAACLDLDTRFPIIDVI